MDHEDTSRNVPRFTHATREGGSITLPATADALEESTPIIDGDALNAKQTVTSSTTAGDATDDTAA